MAYPIVSRQKAAEMMSARRIKVQNVDCLCDADLQAFAEGLKAAVKVVRPGSVRARLIDYAGLVAWSRLERRAGRINEAYRYEREAEAIYATLPARYRW